MPHLSNLEQNTSFPKKFPQTNLYPHSEKHNEQI